MTAGMTDGGAIRVRKLSYPEPVSPPDSPALSLLAGYGHGCDPDTACMLALPDCQSCT